MVLLCCLQSMSFATSRIWTDLGSDEEQRVTRSVFLNLCSFLPSTLLTFALGSVIGPLRFPLPSPCGLRNGVEHGGMRGLRRGHRMTENLGCRR